ncbi:MAG: thioredoxin domain-containing protein [Acidobacteriota bacterium]|nr:thioredoxin domain-containing protein [Acidobacteriota bacterium]
MLLPSALCALPSEAKPNRLANSTSRYLLQHATNPVDWYPWGPEAFAKAKEEDKPIFLSIGYSTCHWCHVMEQESFADPEIGKLMNETFVSIKVDREERPDLDSVYLAVTRTLTGDAGWPNNVILMPDGKPFFAASYIPKERFRGLIGNVRTRWSEQRGQVSSSAEMIMRTLRAPAVAGETLDAAVLEKGYRQLAARYDAAHGGFLPEPKFPMPHHLMFLLRYWQRSGEPKALEMAETTLRAMRAGPLWDAHGFGFHRYSGKADWGEPHYEKMLYDQALLALAYLEAHQATGKAEHAKTARDIFTYVLRDLRGADGAFFAAQDADERYYTAKDRSKMRPPARDEKILSDWNGLMIAALAYGAVVLDEPKYADAAKRAAEVVVKRPRRFLDDHAFLVWGLLNLYEATFDVRWLQSAITIEEETIARFRDEGGRFYVTASDAEPLLVRPSETGDGAIPSGNSVQLMNLIRLARITADAKYEKYANDLLRAAGDEVSLAPSTATHLLSGLSFVLGPSFEIVLSGDDVSAMQRAVFTPFAPNKVVVHRPTGESPPIVAIAPYTKEQQAISRKATAYVCTNYMCKLPTTDEKKIGGLMMLNKNAATK